MSKNIYSPLSQIEQKNIVNHFKNNIIDASLLANNKIMFDYVGLKQPPKEKAVYYFMNQMNNSNSSNSIPPERMAEVRIYEVEKDKYTEYEVLLEDNNSVKIIKSKVIKGARPTYKDYNEDTATSTALKDKRVIQALLDSGVTMEEMKNIAFDANIDGRIYKARNCKTTKECDKLRTDDNPNITRVLYKTKPRPHSYYLIPYLKTTPYLNSFYNQPISDIIILYNALDNTIIKVYKGNENIPIQNNNPDWNARPKGNLLNKVANTIATNKNNFIINDNVIEWSDWKFTIGFHETFGLILYNISFLDRTGWIADNNSKPIRRNILYQANIAELVTTYATNSKVQNQSNILQLGEYTAGRFTRGQVKGIDYPEYASLLSFYFTRPNGDVRLKKDIVSIYEKDPGFLWRFNNFGENKQGQTGIELYVSTLFSVGNDDFTFNWIFSLDGKIKFEVCNSGVLRALASKSDSATLLNDVLVQPNVISNAYCHNVVMRLDFAVDGIKNTICEVNYENKKDNNPYGNVFIEKKKILKSEKKATRNQNFDLQRAWIIYNKRSTNYLGNYRGYKLEPGFSMFKLYNPKQRVCKRANYLLNTINVSLHKDEEYYPTGKYLVESENDTGIRKYIKTNEKIVNKDLVVWYSFGMSRKPTTENYPYINKQTFSFCITPHNFFNENPSLYINNPSIMS
jgi:primary-amine oxidase